MSGGVSEPAVAGMNEPRISIAAFEAAAVDAERFTHEAHVYMAWKYLARTTLSDTLTRYSAALKRLTKKLGVESKYHETITWFFVIEIAERINEKTAGNWAAFRSANPDILRDAKTFLSQHYSRERLASPLAQQQFLLPDLAPPG